MQVVRLSLVVHSQIHSHSLHSPLEEGWVVAPGILHACSYAERPYALQPEAAPCRNHPKAMGCPEGSQLQHADPSSA